MRWYLLYVLFEVVFSGCGSVELMQVVPVLVEIFTLPHLWVLVFLEVVSVVWSPSKSRHKVMNGRQQPQRRP